MQMYRPAWPDAGADSGKYLSLRESEAQPQRGLSSHRVVVFGALQTSSTESERQGGVINGSRIVAAAQCLL